MPLNQYFQNGQKAEQQLFENLIAESIRVYGQDFYYIPRKIVNLDKILNEDILSSFSHSFKIEMFVESIDGFEGDGQLLSKFGLEVRDQFVLVVSKNRWINLVGKYGLSTFASRPTEGDLIYYPVTNNIFEIKFVEDKKPFMQLKNAPIFKMTCELFEYESQAIDTGIFEVDNVQYTNSEAIVFEYTTSDDSISLRVGEKLSFTTPNNITGIVEFFRYEPGDEAVPSRVVVGVPTFDDGIARELTVGTTLVGEKTGADLTITALYDFEDANALLFPNDDFAQNTDFTQTVIEEDFVDFSEDNPFGEN